MAGLPSDRRDPGQWRRMSPCVSGRLSIRPEAAVRTNEQTSMATLEHRDGMGASSLERVLGAVGIGRHAGWCAPHVHTDERRATALRAIREMRRQAALPASLHAAARMRSRGAHGTKSSSSSRTELVGAQAWQRIRNSQPTGRGNGSAWPWASARQMHVRVATDRQECRFGPPGAVSKKCGAGMYCAKSKGSSPRLAMSSWRES